MNLLLALLSAAAVASHAQVSINAEVNKTSVALDDQIVLSVTVSGSAASIPEPEMPSLPNFSVYSSGRSQNISFVNGQVSSSITYTYVLVPHFVGKGTIAPVSATYDGKKVQTSPIEIQVEKPGAAPPGGPPQAAAPRPSAAGATRAATAGAPDVFVTAELDKKKAFVNEQVTLSVKFYTAVSLLGNPQYNAPKIEGFISEDLPPERHGNVTLRGRSYYFSEVRTALFPAHAGKLAIGPASVRCQVQQNVNVDPFSGDFFDRFFSQGMVAAQTKELNSEPLILSAEPLPESGKPKDFSGAVGSFEVAAAIDRERTKVGDAVNLTVTVQGSGNLKAIGDPRMPDLPAFRIYDTVSSLNLDKKNDRVRGSKDFKTVLTPRVSGDVAIPPIAFSYFDPQRRAYLRASTLPIAIKVAAAAPGAAPVAGYTAPAEGASQGLTSVSSDIRYLKTKPAKPLFTQALEAVTRGGLFNGLPFLIFALCLSLAQYRHLGTLDPKGARFRGALKAASRKIQQAAGADPQRAAGLLGDAFAQYLADKLDQPASGLTVRRVQELLRSKKPPIGDALLERVKALWEELDLRRFAPAAGAGEDVSQTLKGLLEDLEKEIPR